MRPARPFLCGEGKQAAQHSTAERLVFGCCSAMLHRRKPVLGRRSRATATARERDYRLAKRPPFWRPRPSARSGEIRRLGGAEIRHSGALQEGACAQAGCVWTEYTAPSSQAGRQLAGGGGLGSRSVYIRNPTHTVVVWCARQYDGGFGEPWNRQRCFCQKLVDRSRSQMATPSCAQNPTLRNGR
jgi:hypothetical protein